MIAGLVEWYTRSPRKVMLIERAGSSPVASAKI